MSTTNKINLRRATLTPNLSEKTLFKEARKKLLKRDIYLKHKASEPTLDRIENFMITQQPIHQELAQNRTSSTGRNFYTAHYDTAQLTTTRNNLDANDALRPKSRPQSPLFNKTASYWLNNQYTKKKIETNTLNIGNMNNTKQGHEVNIDEDKQFIEENPGYQLSAMKQLFMKNSQNQNSYWESCSQKKQRLQMSYSVSRNSAIGANLANNSVNCSNSAEFLQKSCNVSLDQNVGPLEMQKRQAFVGYLLETGRSKAHMKIANNYNIRDISFVKEKNQNSRKYQAPIVNITNRNTADPSICPTPNPNAEDNQSIKNISMISYKQNKSNKPLLKYNKSSNATVTPIETPPKHLSFEEIKKYIRKNEIKVSTSKVFKVYEEFLGISMKSTEIKACSFNNIKANIDNKIEILSSETFNKNKVVPANRVESIEFMKSFRDAMVQQNSSYKVDHKKTCDFKNYFQDYESLLAYGFDEVISKIKIEFYERGEFLCLLYNSLIELFDELGGHLIYIIDKFNDDQKDLLKDKSSVFQHKMNEYILENSCLKEKNKLMEKLDEDRHLQLRRMQQKVCSLKSGIHNQKTEFNRKQIYVEQLESQINQYEQAIARSIKEIESDSKPVEKCHFLKEKCYEMETLGKIFEVNKDRLFEEYRQVDEIKAKTIQLPLVANYVSKGIKRWEKYPTGETNRPMDFKPEYEDKALQADPIDIKYAESQLNKTEEVGKIKDCATDMESFNFYLRANGHEVVEYPELKMLADSNVISIHKSTIGGTWFSSGAVSRNNSVRQIRKMHSHSPWMVTNSNQLLIDPPPQVIVDEAENRELNFAVPERLKLENSQRGIKRSSQPAMNIIVPDSNIDDIEKLGSANCQAMPSPSKKSQRMTLKVSLGPKMDNFLQKHNTGRLSDASDENENQISPKLDTKLTAAAILRILSRNKSLDTISKSDENIEDDDKAYIDECSIDKISSVSESGENDNGSSIDNSKSKYTCLSIPNQKEQIKMTIVENHIDQTTLYQGLTEKNTNSKDDLMERHSQSPTNNNAMDQINENLEKYNSKHPKDEQIQIHVKKVMNDYKSNDQDFEKTLFLIAKVLVDNDSQNMNNSSTKNNNNKNLSPVMGSGIRRKSRLHLESKQKHLTHRGSTSDVKFHINQKLAIEANLKATSSNIFVKSSQEIEDYGDKQPMNVLKPKNHVVKLVSDILRYFVKNVNISTLEIKHDFATVAFKYYNNNYTDSKARDRHYKSLLLNLNTYQEISIVRIFTKCIGIGGFPDIRYQLIYYKIWNIIKSKYKVDITNTRQKSSQLPIGVISEICVNVMKRFVDAELLDRIKNRLKNIQNTHGYANVNDYICIAYQALVWQKDSQLYRTIFEMIIKPKAKSMTFIELKDLFQLFGIKEIESYKFYLCFECFSIPDQNLVESQRPKRSITFLKFEKFCKEFGITSEFVDKFLDSLISKQGKTSKHFSDLIQNWRYDIKYVFAVL